MITLMVVGNIGKDCVVKEVNGKTVMNFNVAHTERFKDSTGTLKEKTTWVECAYWTDATKLAPYLTKGKLIYVDGYPDSSAYISKDNQPASNLKLNVRKLQLLGTSTNENNNTQQVSGVTTATHVVSQQDPGPDFPPDDLPF